MIVIDSFILLLNKGIFEIVILVGMLGVAAATYAFFMLYVQWGELNVTFHDIGYASKQKDKLRELPKEGTHSRIRQLALMEPFKAYQKHKNRGVELSLPSMGDLREITLQTELSRTAPASLNAIVNTLLILGICGTLVGVHVALRGNNLATNLDELKPALRPSIAAIIFTVILMAARTAYAAMVDRFLISLDRWTSELRERQNIVADNAASVLMRRATKSLRSALSKIQHDSEQSVEADKFSPTLDTNSREIIQTFIGVRQIQHLQDERLSEAANRLENARNLLQHPTIPTNEQ